MENDFMLIAVPLTQLQSIIELAVSKALKSNNFSESQLMDSNDIMKLCKISHVTLQKWRNTAKIPYSKIENKILYNKTDVLNALAASK